MAEKRRVRRPIQPGEFEDPLSNYEAPVFEDGLEEALCAATLKDMKLTPFHTFPPTITVGEALRTMAEGDFYCLLIVDDEGRLIGLFTARDVLTKVAEQYEQTLDKPVSEFMTTSPQVVYETDSPAKAINMMAVGGFRHLPVLGVDDRVVGIIGPRRTTRYLFDHLDDKLTTA